LKDRPAWFSAGLILFLTWLLFGMYYLTRFNFSAVIPLLKADLGISNAQAGGLMAFFFVTYTVFQLPAGYLGDRLGPRRILTVGALVSIIGNLIFSQTSSYMAQFFYHPAPDDGGDRSNILDFGQGSSS
jgi:sugar phosphate permease